MAGVALIVADTVALSVCRCSNSEGEHNAENEQLGHNVNWNRDISAIPLRQLVSRAGAHSAQQGDLKILTNGGCWQASLMLATDRKGRSLGFL